MGKKGKQEQLPGMEARDVPEIEQAAENYRKIRDERCELSKREADAKATLIQVMKNLGRSFYQYNGLKVQLEITDNVKVKSSDDGDEEPKPIGDPKLYSSLRQTDDFTAERCDECKMIDGAHTKECSKNPARLTSDDYLAYAQAHYKTNHQSHARKMALTGVKDDEIRAWKLEQQQAGTGAEIELAKESKKHAKLLPVESTIDR